MSGRRFQVLILFIPLLLPLKLNYRADRQHLRELERLRTIYIPELLLRLHTLLLESRQYIPENVRHALNLVNIVADERYGVYQAFGAGEEGRLERYLLDVHAALGMGVEGGGSDVLRVVRVRT